MKYALALTGLILSSFTGLSNERYNGDAYHDFKVGDTCYTWKTDVNLRRSDDLESRIIRKLTIATPVIILEHGSSQDFSEIDASWYKVKILGSAQSGYLWGGTLTMDMIESKRTPGLRYLYGIKAFHTTDNNGYEWTYPWLEMVAVKDGKKLNSLCFRAIGSTSTANAGEAVNITGLHGVEEMVAVHFHDDFCAGAYGTQYVAWNGEELLYFRKLKAGADGGYFYDETLIFPSDKGGVPGKVLMKVESGYGGYEDGDTEYEIRYTAEFHWNGTELIRTKN